MMVSQSSFRMNETTLRFARSGASMNQYGRLIHPSARYKKLGEARRIELMI